MAGVEAGDTPSGGGGGGSDGVSGGEADPFSEAGGGLDNSEARTRVVCEVEGGSIAGLNANDGTPSEDNSTLTYGSLTTIGNKKTQTRGGGADGSGSGAACVDGCANNYERSGLALCDGKNSGGNSAYSPGEGDVGASRVVSDGGTVIVDVGGGL